MNKRDFLKTSGVIVTGSMFSHLVGAEQPAAHRTNWSGNLTFRTGRLYSPASLDEVRAVVKKCDRLRALGSRHSFNAIADSSAGQVSLARLDSIAIDEKAHTATVGAGITYGHLAPVIDARGYALHNFASLPHITVAGACATATHGSGLHNGNLATQVSGLEIVTADGNILRLSRQQDGDRFPGSVVALGALGIVTSVTLNLLPTFQVAQSVYQNLSFDRLEHHLDDIFGSGYSVSLFTDWQHHRATQVWIKRRLAPGDANHWDREFFGAQLATEKLHPITGHPAESCTEQQGIPGPWYERLPHFRMNFTPSSGRELQTEYLVPRERGYQAILAVEKLRDHITPHLFVTELRTIAPDDLWMSTAYQRPSLAVHFTWKPEWQAVRRILPMIEAQLAPFDPRPHWGKLFTLPRTPLQARYERLGDFRQLVAQLDPHEKFRNRFLREHLYAG